MNEPQRGGDATQGGVHDAHGAHGADDAPEGTGEPTLQRSPHDVMGHGGHGAGMSMADMVADMRRRFLIAALFSIPVLRSEEHTSELQSLMRISYAVFCLKKKIKI